MWASDKQIEYIRDLGRRLNRKPSCDPSRLTSADASKMIEQLLSETRRQVNSKCYQYFRKQSRKW
jgi:hypothetical protein